MANRPHLRQTQFVTQKPGEKKNLDTDAVDASKLSFDIIISVTLNPKC